MSDRKFRTSSMSKQRPNYLHPRVDKTRKACTGLQTTRDGYVPTLQIRGTECTHSSD